MADVTGRVMRPRDLHLLLFEVLLIRYREGVGEELARFFAHLTRAFPGQCEVAVAAHAGAEMMRPSAAIERTMPIQCTKWRRSLNNTTDAAVPMRITPTFASGNTMLACRPPRESASTRK